MNWEATNLPETWKKFKQHVELMFSGPLKGKTEAEKVRFLLIWVGEKGRDISNTFTGITNDNKDKLDTYYIKFKEYVMLKSNSVCAVQIPQPCTDHRKF